jgi:hypothetical protein
VVEFGVVVSAQRHKIRDVVDVSNQRRGREFFHGFYMSRLDYEGVITHPTSFVLAVVKQHYSCVESDVVTWNLGFLV